MFRIIRRDHFSQTAFNQKILNLNIHKVKFPLPLVDKSTQVLYRHLDDFNKQNHKKDGFKILFKINETRWLHDEVTHIDGITLIEDEGEIIISTRYDPLLKSGQELSVGSLLCWFVAGYVAGYVVWCGLLVVCWLLLPLAH
jgi:hypothetical protein